MYEYLKGGIVRKEESKLKFRPVWPPKRKLVGAITIDKVLDDGEKGDQRPVLTVQDVDGTIWSYRSPANDSARWTDQAVRVEIVAPAEAGETDESEGAI